MGSLPDELLLCPVCALCLFLSSTAYIPSCPRSPARSLSKNALSFFICEVIAEVYSSSGCSLPSAHSLSSSSVSSSFSSHLGLRFMRMGFVGLWFLGPFTVMLRWLLSWNLLPGLLLPSFLLSTFPMFSSPHPVVMVWILWWRLVLWCRFFMRPF